MVIKKNNKEIFSNIYLHDSRLTLFNFDDKQDMVSLEFLSGWEEKKKQHFI